MKNLTKRNLIVLAIAAVLVITVLAVAAFAQVGGSQLFGATTYAHIDPASANIIPGGTVTLKVSSTLAGVNPKCTFTTPSTAVTLGGATPYTVVVTGARVGSATIAATCNVGTVTAQVIVVAPPSPTPSPTPTPAPTPTPSYLYISPANPRQRCSCDSNGYLYSVRLHAVNAVRPCNWAPSQYTDQYYPDDTELELANRYPLVVRANVTCANGYAFTTVTFDLGTVVH